MGLNGLRLAPPATTAWTPPPRYASPGKFTEREVTLGSGSFAVPGTLTLPRGRGPRPGVVLLASGAADRDGEPRARPGGERPQHVDAAVVAGIADWLVPGRGRGPIARLFSGPRRFDRLCGGRLR
jgi:hypothetical protein